MAHILVPEISFITNFREDAEPAKRSRMFKSSPAMNWIAGISLPMRLLSLVRNKSVPAVAAQAGGMASAEGIFSEPPIRPTTSAVSAVNERDYRRNQAFKICPYLFGCVLDSSHAGTSTPCTMKEIGTHDKSNTILMSHSPAAVGDRFRQMQDAVIIGNKAADLATRRGRIMLTPARRNGQTSPSLSSGHEHRMD